MRYPFSVFQTQVEDHIFWVAKSSVLKGCVGQGDNMDEAISELAENEVEWIDTANEVGIPVPEIPVQQTTEYSGKLSLRIAASVHEKAAQLAKQDGVSLNQYINDAIVARNAELTSVKYISENVVNFVQDMNNRFYTRTLTAKDEDQGIISMYVPLMHSNSYRFRGGNS